MVLRPTHLSNCGLQLGTLCSRCATTLTLKKKKRGAAVRSSRKVRRMPSFIFQKLLQLQKPSQAGFAQRATAPRVKREGRRSALKPSDFAGPLELLHHYGLQRSNTSSAQNRLQRCNSTSRRTHLLLNKCQIWNIRMETISSSYSYFHRQELVDSLLL